MVRNPTVTLFVAGFTIFNFEIQLLLPPLWKSIKWKLGRGSYVYVKNTTSITHNLPYYFFM